jgi:hypothetical protein
MKLPFFSPVACLLLGLLAAPIFAAPVRGDAVSRPYPYRFLISDNLSQQLLIIEKDGSVSWEYPQAGWVYDGARLPNGHVLYCWFTGGKTDQQAGVREVTPDKRIVFEFPVAKECHSVQRLPDGLTLIEDPSNKRLVEVDRQGRIVRELKLQVGHEQVHRVARQCRKLPNGNYLVAQEFDQAVVEYAPDGRMLRRLPVNGMVYGVSRLPNGNTLIGTGGGPDIGKRVVELDPQGNTVWSFEPSDFPADTNLDWVVGAQRLANGHTVIANFLGHGKEGRGISLLEAGADKQILWTYREKRIVLLMQVLEE